MGHEETKIVNKLNLKNLGCNPAAVKMLPASETKLAVARIYGKVHSVRLQEDKAKGEISSYFVGTFEGINLQDGKMVRSTKLFLPSGISSVIEKAVKAAEDKDDSGSIRFLFEFRSAKAQNSIGYQYEAVALKGPEVDDELAELRSIAEKYTARKPEPVPAKKAS